MGAQVHGDTIESLILERRETQKEVKELQDRIDRLCAQKGENGENPESDSPAALDMQIEELTREKRERAQKLKNICRMARTISAGD